MKNHLMSAQTDWGNSDWFKKEATAEQWNRLIALGCDLPASMENREHIYQANFIGAVSEFAQINEEFPFLKWTVSKVRGINYAPDFDVHRLSDGKIDQVDSHTPQINNICVAGQALHDIRTITWVEDSCTEFVQSALDKGWKIVAVCPPNDSRRPTYILGHNEAGQAL